jgi:hypothetical protein
MKRITDQDMASLLQVLTMGSLKKISRDHKAKNNQELKSYKAQA